ncbi:hypothetical protein ACEN9F_11075 [Duganella sp. CT11-25]|uniref:hypothetical protein n=1 Tax=unclassified Duganella TaxID=2636909 RepID=UPI0039AFF8D1
MKPIKEKTPGGSASAAKRNAVKGLAAALGKTVQHTTKPNNDFDALLEEIPKELRKKALNWYERGIRRGMTIATDMMADGQITFDGEYVRAPNTINARVRTKFAKGDWEDHKFKIPAADLGFD